MLLVIKGILMFGNQTSCKTPHSKIFAVFYESLGAAVKIIQFS